MVRYFFSENLKLIREISLPDRGHDIVFSPVANKAIAFARRPGNFALVIDLTKAIEPAIITAPMGRHFYGHGVFSHDGKLLYASENDFDNAIGKIGIYDVTAGFSRIGEFDSFGVGPHEILLLADNKTLVVANGGIETHPDFGRGKLNIANMQPCITFINTQSGSLIEKQQLPNHLHKLSLRHMVEIINGAIVFGGQYQGAKTDRVQLVGRCTLGEGISLWELNDAITASFANYTGSLAINKDKSQVAVSSPKGGMTAILDAKYGNLLAVHKLPNGNGIAYTSSKLHITSSEGKLLNLDAQSSIEQFDFVFDNHLKSAGLRTL